MLETKQLLQAVSFGGILRLGAGQKEAAAIWPLLAGAGGGRRPHFCRYTF